MAATETKQETSDQYYDLGEVRIRKKDGTSKVAIVGSVKIESKITLERKTSISSYEGYAWQKSSEEHTFELGDVEDLDFFRALWQSQKSDMYGFTLTFYNFIEGGDYVEKGALYGCQLDSDSFELSDKPKQTIKGEALRRKSY